jgi:hypothetical protein
MRRHLSSESGMSVLEALDADPFLGDDGRLGLRTTYLALMEGQAAPRPGRRPRKS